MKKRVKSEIRVQAHAMLACYRAEAEGYRETECCISSRGDVWLAEQGHHPDVPLYPCRVSLKTGQIIAIDIPRFRWLTVDIHPRIGLLPTYVAEMIRSGGGTRKPAQRQPPKDEVGGGGGGEQLSLF